MSVNQRPYTTSDAEAVERCGIATVTLTNHLAAFAAELAEFTPAFVSAWRAQVLAAQQFPSEEYTDDQSRMLRNAVNDAVKGATSAVTPIRFFAHEAFGKGGYYRSFRFSEFNAQRSKPSALVTYLRALHRTAIKHQVALTAKGMTPAHLTALTAAATALATAEEEHEYFKNEKMAMAYERGQLHTAMWRTFQQVSRAADLVFMNDPIKRALFNVG